MASANDNTLPAQALTQAAAAVSSAIKIAKAAEDRLSKAPKAVPQAEIEKTAGLLLQHGWITKDREESIKQALADPATAMTALQNVIIEASKAANQDPRLSSGRAVGQNDNRRPMAPEKRASVDDESPADKAYLEKVANYRLNGRV